MRILSLVFALFSVIYAKSPLDFKLNFKNIDSAVMANIGKYFVSEKFDGVRGIWNGAEMFSKNGKQIAIPQCFRDKLAKIQLKKGEFIEGEFWGGYESFEETSGIIRLKSPKCEDYENIKYLIFNANLAEGDFITNLAKISQLSLDSQISVIEQRKVDSTKDLQDFLRQVIKKGGEGLIVRDATIAFKLKAQNDAECEIIDYTQGRGRLSGKIGAIVCKARADKNYGIENGVIFRIGSGLSDEMRGNPPKIGTIITYQFSGLSKNGVPKHTRFKRIYEEN